MTPGSVPPGLVEVFQGLVARLQPVAKTTLAEIAMAFTAVFIGDMPVQHRRV